MAKYLPPSATIGRVDQGVDVSSKSGSIGAIGDGHVYAVTPWAVYYTLDKPVTVGGRTYSNVYAAETQHPVVKVGQRVTQGQPVASYTPGTPWSEIGFAAGNSKNPVASPYSPPIGGLGAGTKPSQAGYDFLTILRGGKHSIGTPAPSNAASLAGNVMSGNVAPAAQVQQGINPLLQMIIQNNQALQTKPQGYTPF